MRWLRPESFTYYGDLVVMGFFNAMLILGAAVAVSALLGALVLSLAHTWFFDTSCLDNDAQQEAAVEEPQNSPAAG